MPDPTPSASPVPPERGIYGLPLTPYGDGELREKLPDGGYIRWGREKRKDGAVIWVPQDHYEADNKIKA